MTDLGSINETVISKASQEGVSDVECFSMKWRSRAAYVEDSRPNIALDDEESGIGVKVAIGKKIGFASATFEEKEDALSALDSAIKIARLSPDDPNFESFPSTKKVSASVEGVFDKSILEATSEELMDKAMIVVNSAMESDEMGVPKGHIRAQEYEFKISNSTGLENGHRGTLLFASFSSKITEGGKSGEGIEKVYSTQLGNIDFEGIGTKISSRAINTLNARPFKGKLEAPTIIANIELGQMLLSSVASALSGENVNKKRSPWADKLDAKLFSDELSMFDRPHLPNAMQSAPIDDEGTPTEDRQLIEKGVLKRFINDHYNAGISDQEAGNGYRRGVGTIEKSYSAPATCAVSNLTIPPGNKSLEDMISEMDKGIFVEKFAAPEANPFMGAFGLEVRNASIIEKGELKEYVKFALLSGNLYESLGKIISIGNDVEFGGPYIISDSGDSYCPSIAFDGFMLIGQD